MKLRELPQIMALSTEEKLELTDEMWESISPELEQAGISEQERKLLDDRWERHLAHPEAALTPEQMKAAVTSLLE